MVTIPGRGLYAFAGDRVWRYAPGRGTPEPGYPRPITAEFPGVFARDVDAALLHPDGDLYLFRGAQHVRYDLGEGRPRLGFPRPYAHDWPGVFPNRIDAALAWNPEIIYVFSGDSYTSFAPDRGGVRRGFPKPIAGNWPGLRGGPVRAALTLDGGRQLLLADGYAQTYDREGRTTDGDVGWILPGQRVPGAHASAVAAPAPDSLAVVERLAPAPPAPASPPVNWIVETFDLDGPGLRPCHEAVWVA